MARQLRIGHGFDVHRFGRGRKLLLGGVEIPAARGLTGHSDADVLVHALINALLGAMGDGDIGTHFPDNDSRYKGIASSTLLEIVLQRMRKGRFKLENADTTIIAQQPRLAPYYGRIRKRLADLLGVEANRINVKASTPEKLGELGAGRGIAATAVVLLSK